MYILDLEFIPGTYPAVASGNKSVTTVDGKRIVFTSHNLYVKGVNVEDTITISRIGDITSHVLGDCTWSEIIKINKE